MVLRFIGRIQGARPDDRDRTDMIGGPRPACRTRAQEQLRLYNRDEPGDELLKDDLSRPVQMRIRFEQQHPAAIDLYQPVITPIGPRIVRMRGKVLIVLLPARPTALFPVAECQRRGAGAKHMFHCRPFGPRPGNDDGIGRRQLGSRDIHRDRRLLTDGAPRYCRYIRRMIDAGFESFGDFRGQGMRNGKKPGDVIVMDGLPEIVGHRERFRPAKYKNGSLTPAKAILSAH